MKLVSIHNAATSTMNMPADFYNQPELLTANMGPMLTKSGPNRAPDSGTTPGQTTGMNRQLDQGVRRVCRIDQPYY